MDITSHFRRNIPNDIAYYNRLARELRLIEKFKFEEVFLQIREILDLAPDFRWVTRGSAGCSLVGYLSWHSQHGPNQEQFCS